MMGGIELPAETRPGLPGRAATLGPLDRKALNRCEPPSFDATHGARSQSQNVGRSAVIAQSSAHAPGAKRTFCFRIERWIS